MKVYLFGIVFLAFINTANAADYIWSEAVPKEIHIVPEGLVVVGDFNNSGVTCATGASAIILKKSDPNFDAKLSLALTAKATGNKIQVLIKQPFDTNCMQISAHGNIPIAFHYYWRLK